MDNDEQPKPVSVDPTTVSPIDPVLGKIAAEGLHPALFEAQVLPFLGGAPMLDFTILSDMRIDKDTGVRVELIISILTPNLVLFAELMEVGGEDATTLSTHIRAIPLSKLLEVRTIAKVESPSTAAVPATWVQVEFISSESGEIVLSGQYGEIPFEDPDASDPDPDSPVFGPILELEGFSGHLDTNSIVLVEDHNLSGTQPVLDLLRFASSVSAALARL